MFIQIPDFSQARVAIFGDVMLDRYWQGNTHRISPEAPVPVVHVRGRLDCPGGAGNVALNVVSLGAQATLFGLCGNDEAAHILKQKLDTANVESHLQCIDDLPTTTKLRILSVHQQLLRLDFEEPYHEVNNQPLMSLFLQALPEVNVLILSDYGKGCLYNPAPLIQAAKNLHIPVIVDPKRNDFTAYTGATIITPNFGEFIAVVGECLDEKQIVEKGLNLIEACGLEALLITRGGKGMTLLQRHDEPLHLPALSREVYDVTGAGDTVIALLATSVATGAELSRAMLLANTAAGVVVEKLGAASVTVDELKKALTAQHLRSIHLPDRGIFDQKTLLSAISTTRGLKEKIVMVAGYFDILHKGHLDFLETAKSFGDQLLIAVYDDSGGHAVHSLQARMQVLAELDMVDWVTPVATEELASLIKEIFPDILVMAREPSQQNLVYDIQSGHAGEVKILEMADYLPDLLKFKVQEIA